MSQWVSISKKGIKGIVEFSLACNRPRDFEKHKECAEFVCCVFLVRCALILCVKQVSTSKTQSLANVWQKSAKCYENNVYIWW